MKKLIKNIIILSMILINKIIPNKIYECSKRTKRCSENIRNKNYKYYILGKNTPNCCLNNLKKILEDVINVLEKDNKKYFIIWGTFLGAVRHKGFIPWDTDIDIGILRKDYKSIIDLLIENLNEKYIIDFSKLENENLVRINFSKINTLHIDIEIWDEKENKIYYEDGYETYSFEEEDFFPLRKYKFEDLNLDGPNNYNKILSDCYGNNFKEIGYKKYALMKKKIEIFRKDIK